MIRTPESNMAEELRKAHEADVADLVKSAPKAEEVYWRVWLDRQDLNELRETAKKVSTKVSGNKQEVRDAIVAKFTVYEDLYKGMTKAELFDVCQTRGVKGVSTLTKDPLINRLIRSFFEVEKKIVIPVAVAIASDESDDSDDRPKIPLAVAIAPKLTKKKACDDISLSVLSASLSSKVAETKAVETKAAEVKAAEVKAAEVKAAEAKAVKAAEVKAVKAAEVAEAIKAAEVKAAEAKAAEAKAVKEAEVAEAIKAAEAKKKTKAAIPKKVKNDVWNTYIGADINKHRCLCCKKTVISNTDFDVGHVTSESTGGTLEIGNLRPICSACNHSMGTRNMVDFVKMFGYFIG
jgi:hypothetical protein